MKYRRNCCNTLNPADYPATGMLIREHQILEHKLQGYGQAIVNRDVRAIRDFASFMVDTFMPLHFGKEEQVAFLLYNRHLSIFDETVPNLMHEHDDDQQKFCKLIQMIDTNADYSGIKALAGSLCDSIGHHMEEETKLIFPRIEAALTEEEIYLAVSRMANIGYLS